MHVCLRYWVLQDGRAIGYITSGGYTHNVGKSVAMAYVASECGAADSKVQVEILGQMYDAVVQGGPLYDPDGSRMRS